MFASPASANKNFQYFSLNAAQKITKASKEQYFSKPKRSLSLTVEMNKSKM